MQVTIPAAKAQLSKLIQAALAGEAVIIANGDTLVVKLVPLQRSRYRLGGLEGKIAPPPDQFFARLRDAE